MKEVIPNILWIYKRTDIDSNNYYARLKLPGSGSKRWSVGTTDISRAEEVATEVYEELYPIAQKRHSVKKQAQMLEGGLLQECNTCKEIKPLDEYRETKQGGLYKTCSACLDHKKKMNSKFHRGSEHLIAEGMIRTARQRDKKKGHETNITVEDLLPFPNVCPILGIPIKTNAPVRSDNVPSLDHINPKKGAIKGNVQVVSWRANALKRDSTPEEREKLYMWDQDMKAKIKNLKELFRLR